MELTNEFTLPVPPDRAWQALADVERVVSCMPGARLTEVDGDELTGEVKVKVGPVSATYQGTARFTERDPEARRAVLQATGSDVRQGQATATVTATLAPEGDATKVVVVTDLDVAGKVAQFGQGALDDISAKLLDQFAECLRAELDRGADAIAIADDIDPSPALKEFATAVVEASPDEAPARGAANGSGPRKIDAPEPEPVDLLSAAGVPVARRLAPVAGAVAALVVFLLFWRRRR